MNWLALEQRWDEEKQNIDEMKQFQKEIQLLYVSTKQSKYIHKIIFGTLLFSSLLFSSLLLCMYLFLEKLIFDRNPENVLIVK